METGWNTFFTSTDRGVDGQGHNGNFTNSFRNTCNISTTITTTTVIDATPYDNNNNYINPASGTKASVVHTLLFGMPDPHITCLKLGKRHYYDDAVVTDPYVTAESSFATKREKQGYSCYVSGKGELKMTSSTKCQVDGCHMALVGVKEYYKRHKVCEIHSKAPMVVVSGRKRRFCQQCSRFHDVTEFDEAKRSCRRRLEGHNLRRRKGTIPNENSTMTKPRFEPLSTPSSSLSPSQLKPVCALSLLSSSKTEPWMSSGDLSSRCSAALYELIAANRATSVSGHILNQNSSHQPIANNTMYTSHNMQMWDRFGHTTMTLDQKHAPALDFSLWSMKEKPKDPEEWTDYCWSSFGGTNVV